MAVTQLDIRYITEVNPTWARSDIGPMTSLTKDIQKHGVRKPLLIQEDFLMLDGARRTEAALALKMSMVPVIICRTWADILEHLRPSDPDCYPMNWVDLVDYWGITLKGLQHKHQRIAAGNTRRGVNAGDDVRKPNTYSQYTNDLATIYNVEPSTIKLIRDYLTRLQRLESKFPTFVKGLYSRFPTGEDARDLARARYIKSLLERVRQGELTEEDALVIYDLRMQDNGPMFTYRRARARDSNIDPSAKPTPFAQLDNLVNMLEQLAVSAEGFMNFPSTDTGTIQEYVSRISESVSSISIMRRRLETVATKQRS